MTGDSTRVEGLDTDRTEQQSLREVDKRWQTEVMQNTSRMPAQPCKADNEK